MNYERSLNDGPFEPTQLSEIQAVFARWYSKDKQDQLMSELGAGKAVVVHHRRNNRQELRVAK